MNREKRKKNVPVIAEDAFMNPNHVKSVTENHPKSQPKSPL